MERTPRERALDLIHLLVPDWHPTTSQGVLFYTDGLIEAHNSQGEMFGTPRLRGLLRERSEDGRGLSATLMEDLYSFVGEGWEQEDVITLLTLGRAATNR